MEVVSFELIEEACERLEKSSLSQFRKLLHKYQKRQPVILVYLYASCRDDLNDKEQDLLLFLGTVVLDVLTKVCRNPRMISIEALEAIKESNVRLLEQLESRSSENLFDFTMRFVESHPQKNLLRFVVETVMEDDPEITHEGQGLIFLILKNVIDALIQEPVEKSTGYACGWCKHSIAENHETFTFGISAHHFDSSGCEGGYVRVVFPSLGRRLVAGVPMNDSPAKRQGHDLVFLLCSERCGDALGKALRRDATFEIVKEPD